MLWINILLLFSIVQVNQDSYPLMACPDSPNCVNSYQLDEKHEPMEPLVFSGDYQVAMKNLADLVDEMPRTEILDQEETYLHVSFTIAVFGFVDDVEFKADTVNNLIHFRSASRKGYHDLWVNKGRMKDITEMWLEAQSDIKK